MSNRLLTQVWAIDDPELKEARLVTLLALADFANNDTDQCWPSIPTLAQRARVGERHMRRILQWLVGEEYIRIELKGNGRNHPTIYTVSLKGDITMSSFPQEKGDITMSSFAHTKGDIMMSSFAHTKGDIMMSSFAHTKGDIGDTKGDIGGQNYSHARSDPQLEPMAEKDHLSFSEKGESGKGAENQSEAPQNFLSPQEWQACITELSNQHDRYAEWLPGSELLPSDEVRGGRPVWRLLVVNDKARDWLMAHRMAIVRLIDGRTGGKIEIDVTCELPAASVKPPAMPAMLPPPAPPSRKPVTWSNTQRTAKRDYQPPYWARPR